MIVRELEKGDIASVMKLTEAMHQEAPHYRDFPYSEQKVLALTEVFLTNPDWLCVVAEHDEKLVGFFAVTIIPTFFGYDDFVEDISLYVSPVSRGTSAALRMLRMVEAWALGRGAKAIRLGLTTGVRVENGESFFLKLGYEETGKLFTKLISPLKLETTH